MGILGWDYPAGCSSVPGDEYETFDLSKGVSARMGVPCEAYWGEDNALYAMRSSERTGSEDQAPRLPHDCAWEDELSASKNYAMAVECVVRQLMGDV